MTTFLLSNVKQDSLTPLDFYRNENFKREGLSGRSSTWIPIFEEILRDALGDLVDQNLIDYPLSFSQSLEIRNQFSIKLTELLPLREIIEPYDRKFLWEDETYELNQGLTSPNNRRIWNYYSIIQIAKECILENKPMYLTIEQ